MSVNRFFLFLSLCLIFGGCVRKNYFQKDALYVPGKGKQIKAAPPGQVLAVIAPQYVRSRFHEIIWGRHYREVWATPVPMPMLDIRKVHGGLKPEELGGGMQSTSLSLRDPQGRLFTLRTLDKDPSKALPPVLRKTFVANIMRDQTSAGNPYAAFTLPPLVEAIGIFHTHPELYYVPFQDNGLGQYSSLLAGKVMMLEEKYKGEESVTPEFGAASDLVDSDEMLKNRFASNKYEVDQLEFAKARLFDVLIGDWDRHEGQWNWAEYPDKKKEKVIYKAVPKDRDQTYYRFDDGIMPWIVSRRFLVQKLRPFKHNIQDVEGLIFNSRFIDERFLNELTAEQWTNIGRGMKATLTDDLLRRSVALMPDTIQKLEGKKTLSKLKERVDQLPDAAGDFYRILAKNVTVAGSDDGEKFLVKRLDDETTSVEVWTLPGDEKEAARRLYQRVFRHTDTKTVTLHGLGEDDEFLVEGKTTRGLKIIINGGLGADKITDKSFVKNGSKKTIVMDTRNGNELDLGKESKNKTSTKVTIHAFDREGF